MINGYAAATLAVAVGTFFSAGTMERGMKMSYSIRLAIGIALLYNDLQNKEEFVLSVWYADGILDTLIETDQDAVFHFP